MRQVFEKYTATIHQLAIDILTFNMSSDAKWEGWLGHDADSVNGHMVWGEYEPKTWEENDVDIAITHSSVCGTDVHVLRNEFVRSRPDLH